MDDELKASAPDEAALLLHLSGNTVSDSAVQDGIFTVFVDSSLDTHMAVSVSQRDTVADLKSKIRSEHSSCFPALGDIVIHAIKVKRRKFLYHLSDSMLVKSAFNGQMRTWFLHMDVSTFCSFTHQEEPRQVLSTPEMDVQMEVPESLEAVSCKQVDGTLKRLASTTDESKDDDVDDLGKDGHLIEGFTNRSDNHDDQLLLSQNAELVNRKSIVSEQAVQGHGEENVLNVSDAVGENPASVHKASISAEERAVDLDKLQKYDTNSRTKEDVNLNNLKSGIVSSDTSPSKSKRRKRGQGEPAVDSSMSKGLLVPVSENEKETIKKRKNMMLELNNASSKVDVAVDASHTAEKSEFEKHADLIPPTDDDAVIDKSNCTPENLRGEVKSADDIVKVKRKKRRNSKSQEADHDNFSSYHEVVVDECNRKVSPEGTVAMTNIGSTSISPQDGESKLSASCGMYEKGLKNLPPVESSRDSEHVTKKKRKRVERTKDHVTLSPETPFVNHHNDSPSNELPLVSGHNNTANNGDTTEQINGTKPLEKMNLYAETNKVDTGCTVSSVQSLTSTEAIGIDVVPGREIARADDGMVSKDSKRKKSKKTQIAVGERCIVPQGVADGVAPNALGSEYIEPMQGTSTYNNKDSAEKGKRSRKKVKNVDSEISAPDGKLLSPAIIEEKCMQNKEGSSKRQLTSDDALTWKQSQEKSINPNMESIHEGAVEGGSDNHDGCSNDSDISDKINGIKSSERRNLYAETKKVDAGHMLSASESLTSMKGLDIDSIPEKEMTRAENGLVSKDSKRKKPKNTESAIAVTCTVPQVVADKVAPNAVSPDHVEPMDESTYNRNVGTEKRKKTRRKVKNVDSEISMSVSQLLSPSTMKEKNEQNKHSFPNMKSIHEGAVEGGADHDDGCSDNGDITDHIDEANSLEQMNLYAESKKVDAGHTLSGNELLTTTKDIGVDAVSEREITQAENSVVSKVSKRKKSKKTESAVAEKCVVPQLEADKLAANTVDAQHIEPMDVRITHSKKVGSTEKGRRSHKKIKDVDSEIFLPDGKPLSPTVKEKIEQDKQGSLKVQLINTGAVSCKLTEGEGIKTKLINAVPVHEVAAEGDSDNGDGCSSSSDRSSSERVKEREIHRPQNDSVNFIDHFVSGLKTGSKQVHDEGAASGKITKKGHTGQNSASLREANVSGASNHVRSSRGRDSEEQSHATTDASSSNLSASSSDKNLASSGSETLSSDAESDDLTHGNGYLGTPAARNVGSIGRKMVQTRSMTAGRLSEIFKSSSTCRKAVLQASKSKHQPSKVDVDTDSPPVDTVAETQDSQAVTRLF